MADKTFKQAYGVLQRHAETLRNQQEPNIDDLLTIVTESVDAYKVCQERINAVEKALQVALSGAGVSTAAGIGDAETGADADEVLPPPARASGVRSDPDDGDCPF